MATTTAVPPEKAEGLIRDIIEYHSEMVIAWSDDDDRLGHWRSLQYFCKLYLRANRSRFGRVCNRIRMADLVVMACHPNPYVEESNDDADDDGKGDSKKRSKSGDDVAPDADEDPSLDDQCDDRQPKPLVKWGPEDWDSLEELFSSLRESLLRKDAAKTKVDETLDSNRIESDLYERKFKDMLGMISANKAVSSFREELEAGAPVDQSLLVDFRNSLDGVHDRKVRLVLEQFLGSDEEEDAASTEPTLADPDELKKTLASKPMNLKKFQGKFMELLKAWHSDIFRNRLPALVNLGYGDDTAEIIRGTARVDSNRKHRQSRREFGSDYAANEENQPPAAKKSSSAELKHMRKARKTLYKTADDPFPEAYETAARANGGSRKKRVGVKAESKPVKVHFSSSESSCDEDEEELESVHMSDLPLRRDMFRSRATSFSPRKREAEGRASIESASRKQRKRFSEEEKRAIREGVNRHGVGKWAEILKDYNFILNARTNVQIKDCYRTMKKNKEV